MFNIKSTATINYYSDRLPFVVTKYSAEDHIPADIQLSSLLHIQLQGRSCIHEDRQAVCLLYRDNIAISSSPLAFANMELHAA